MPSFISTQNFPKSQIREKKNHFLGTKRTDIKISKKKKKKKAMIRVYTDENETLVRLGGALHAAEKLRHQINGRYFLQYYSRRGTHSLLRISPSLSGEVGVRRGGVFKAFNSPLLNFQVVWIFCLTVLSLLVLLMPPLFYLFHWENLKKARA